MFASLATLTRSQIYKNLNESTAVCSLHSLSIIYISRGCSLNTLESGSLRSPTTRTIFIMGVAYFSYLLWQQGFIAESSKLGKLKSKILNDLQLIVRSYKYFYITLLPFMSSEDATI